MRTFKDQKQGLNCAGDDVIEVTGSDQVGHQGDDDEFVALR